MVTKPKEIPASSTRHPGVNEPFRYGIKDIIKQTEDDIKNLEVRPCHKVVEEIRTLVNQQVLLTRREKKLVQYPAVRPFFQALRTLQEQGINSQTMPQLRSLLQSPEYWEGGDETLKQFQQLLYRLRLLTDEYFEARTDQEKQTKMKMFRQSFENLFLRKGLDKDKIRWISLADAERQLARRLSPEERTPERLTWLRAWIKNNLFDSQGRIPYYLINLINQEVSLHLATGQQQEAEELVKLRQKIEETLQFFLQQAGEDLALFRLSSQQAPVATVQRLEEQVAIVCDLLPQQRTQIMAEVQTVLGAARWLESQRQIMSITCLPQCWANLQKKVDHSFEVAVTVLEGPIFPNTKYPAGGLGEPLLSEVKEIITAKQPFPQRMSALYQLARRSVNTLSDFIIQNQITALIELARDYFQLYTHNANLEEKATQHVAEFKAQLLSAFSDAPINQWREALLPVFAKIFGAPPSDIVVRGKSLHSVHAKKYRKKININDVRDLMGMAVYFPALAWSPARLIARANRLMNEIVLATGLSRSNNVYDNYDNTVGQGVQNENSTGNFHVIKENFLYQEAIPFELQIVFDYQDDHDQYAGNRNNQARDNFNLNYRYVDFLFDLMIVYNQLSIDGQQDKARYKQAELTGRLLYKKLTRTTTYAQLIEEIFTYLLDIPSDRTEDLARIMALAKDIYQQAGLSTASFKEDLEWLRERWAVLDMRARKQMSSVMTYFWKHRHPGATTTLRQSVLPAILYMQFTRNYLGAREHSLAQEINREEHYLNQERDNLNSSEVLVRDRELKRRRLMLKNLRRRIAKGRVDFQPILNHEHKLFMNKWRRQVNFLRNDHGEEAPTLASFDHPEQTALWKVSVIAEQRTQEKLIALKQEMQALISHDPRFKNLFPSNWSRQTLDQIETWAHLFPIPSVYSCYPQIRKINGLFKYLLKTHRYLQVIANGQWETFVTSIPNDVYSEWHNLLKNGDVTTFSKHAKLADGIARLQAGLRKELKLLEAVTTHGLLSPQ